MRASVKRSSRSLLPVLTGIAEAAEECSLEAANRMSIGEEIVADFCRIDYCSVDVRNHHLVWRGLGAVFALRFRNDRRASARTSIAVLA